MVKYINLIFVFFLLPLFLFSAEFSASVTDKNVGVNESFTLHLTLKDTSAKGSPSIESLKKSFHIHSQQQTSSTTIINGHISSSLMWTFILQPKQEGETFIPSIDIQTSEGTLTTDPIKITVTHEVSKEKSSAADEITLTTEVSTRQPYKNETFFLTLVLKSKIDLVNINMPKFSIEDAIIEMNGEPRIEKSIIGSTKFNTITFSYLITPLNAGTLHIPAITLEGATPVKRKTQSHSFFDPVFLMSGFDHMQSFIKTSAPITLHVRPSVAGMSPWLPARHLTIEESWDPSQKLEVGEPLSRSIKIVAEGILCSQLPTLTENGDPQIHSAYKIYADKPQMGNEVKENSIHSYRLEQYTLIPQESGSLILPEIALEWWDVTKNQKALAFLPSRSIEIAPKVQKEENRFSTEQDPSINAASDPANQRDPLLYGLIAALALLLIAAAIWVAVLQKKISQITAPPKTDKPRAQKAIEPPKVREAPKKDKKEKLPDLNPT